METIIIIFKPIFLVILTEGNWISLKVTELVLDTTATGYDYIIQFYRSEISISLGNVINDRELVKLLLSSFRRSPDFCLHFEAALPAVFILPVLLFFICSFC